jgi:NAD-dependent deacetylase
MKVVFFTGAGISAESGISTFRDVNGLWDNHKIEEICNIQTYKKNKEAVFRFYNERRMQLESVEPNIIHTTMARMQTEFKKHNIPVEIITQNIDDLLERAGCTNVLHVHGNLTKMNCKKCEYSWDIGYTETDVEELCPKCLKNENVKPSVIFFGEDAPRYREMKRILNSLTEEDILVVMGTMGNVVSINTYAGFVKCRKFLNNLERSIYINNNYFDYTYFEKGSSAILKIEKMIKSLSDVNY